MSDSLIERVKWLAEAQKQWEAALDAWGKVAGARGFGEAAVELTQKTKQAFAHEALDTDFPALLAHMQAQQAMVAEAREERVEAAKRLSRQAARWLDDFIADSELIDAINGELAAALERMKP